jgi:hypothetical protein
MAFNQAFVGKAGANDAQIEAATFAGRLDDGIGYGLLNALNQVVGVHGVFCVKVGRDCNARFASCAHVKQNNAESESAIYTRFVNLLIKGDFYATPFL